MKEYTITLRLGFETILATQATSEQEAIDEIMEYVNDYKIYFDKELFEFDDVEVVSVEEGK
jgi:formylmethanofuran dehydrogenase subunit E